MRLVKLTMTAFGSYTNSEVIDFESFGSKGLYIITGGTGAGKTVIFDAVCYALFNVPSGNNRSLEMLKSRYSEGKPTSVELVFDVGNKRYTIKRTMSYKTEGRKTNVPATVELVCPNGSIHTVKEDVDNELKSVLGVDGDQFRQIAVLAQGEFKEFLMSSTKKRTEIFRKLFKTDKYNVLTEILKKDKSDSEAKVNDLKQQITQFMDTVKADGTPCVEMLEEAKGKGVYDTNILSVIDEITKYDNEVIVASEKRDVELSKEIAKSSFCIEQANEKKKREIELANCNSQLEKLVLSSEEIKLRYNNAKENLKQKDSLISDFATVQKSLPEYEELDKKVSGVSLTKKNVQELKNRIDSDLKTFEEKDKQIADIGNELLTLTSVGANIEKLTIQITSLKEKKADLETLKKDFGRYMNLVDEFEAKDEKLTSDNEAYQVLKAEYEHKEALFIAGQSGRLARTLIDNKPCPVCGNKVHPNPAPMLDGTPSEEEFDAFKAKYNQAQNEITEYAKEVSKFRGLVEQEKKNIHSRVKAYFEFSDEAEIVSKLQEVVEDNNAKLVKFTAELNNEIKNVSRKEEIDKLLPEITSEKKALEDKINDGRRQVAALEAQVAEQDKNISEIRSKLKFDSRKSAEEYMNNISKQINELEQAYSKAEAEDKKNSEDINSLRGKISAISDLVKKLPDFDIDALNAELASLQAEHTSVNRAKQDAIVRSGNNKNVYDSLKPRLDDIKANVEKYEMIKSLADTADGGLSKQAKLKFETFVQSRYFDQVVKYANERFKDMSSNQYELRRREVPTNNVALSGLDLDVVDHFNNSVSDVATLSGGESFMASLALALGLSDKIQQSLGGVKVESFFIDEGFGTLDKEKVELTYNALKTLTKGNRLIGIISHVKELEELIDNKIIVHKAVDASGSKTEIVTK